MTDLPTRTHIWWRRTSLTVFVILVCFWIIKLVYCGHGYFANGITGLQNALMHGALVPSDHDQWGRPRWVMIGLQYAGIALLTVLFAFDNRHVLKLPLTGQR